MVRRKRTLIYFALAVGMLIYAVPRLEIGNGWTEETIFGAAWIIMALLIIAAQLHELIGVNEKVRKDMNAVKRYKYWRMQQRLIERTRRHQERS